MWGWLGRGLWAWAVGVGVLAVALAVEVVAHGVRTVAPSALPASR